MKRFFLMIIGDFLTGDITVWDVYYFVWPLMITQLHFNQKDKDSDLESALLIAGDFLPYYASVHDTESYNQAVKDLRAYYERHMM